MEIGVLGAVRAQSGAGSPVALGGPRQRALLARLVVAQRRVVPVQALIDAVWPAPPTFLADAQSPDAGMAGHAAWPEPPADAVGTVRTFVAALRRTLEPDRVPRTPARLLVTEGPGYALRLPDAAVDAWRFAAAVDGLGDATPARVAATLTEALGWWRGPAYAEAGQAPWAAAPRARLTELRLHAVERLAEARIALGDTDSAADLDAHVLEHPWREEGWRLLALAHYRSGRRADALGAVRRARTVLRDRLGIDPGPRLARLEREVLHQAEHLDPAGGAARIWAEATAAYASTAPDRARLTATVHLLRDLAVTGGTGLEAAQRHRSDAVAAAEELGDPELTARVIGAYDVPALWPRADDPPRARALVRAAERTLAALPGAPALRCRLLATIAVESRGADATPRAAAAAREAERLARELGDPALLAQALNGRYMQSFTHTGRAPERAAIGTELLALADRTGQVRTAVLGHLVRLQSACALDDLDTAEHHATAVDAIAAADDIPLVTVFTTWYRALRTARTEPYARARTAYLRAAETLAGSGMPGLTTSLLPLALAALHLQHDRPLAPADHGPAHPWLHPLLLAESGDHRAARTALRILPDPPPDPHAEALWCAVARAALVTGDPATITRAHTALTPAAAEIAGAAGGLLTAGPVATHLAALESATSRDR